MLKEGTNYNLLNVYKYFAFNNMHACKKKKIEPCDEGFNSNFMELGNGGGGGVVGGNDVNDDILFSLSVVLIT